MSSKTQQKISGAALDITFELKNTKETRLFCTLPTRRFPSAVLRNKIKRWCREAWRAAGFNKVVGIVVLVRVKNPTVTYTEIQKDFGDAAGSWSK
jgi:ribonuclease P protein component